jgi:hypothetical protein
VPSPRHDRRTAGNSRVARAAHNSIGNFNRFLAYYWSIRQLVRNQSDGRELTMGRWSMPTNMKVPVVTAPVRVRNKKRTQWFRPTLFTSCSSRSVHRRRAQG